MTIEDAALTAKGTATRLFETKFKLSVTNTDAGRIWVAPDNQVVKINCDGSWFSETGKAGFGCIARDSHGHVLGIRAGTLNGISSSYEAEGMAILQAMNWASMRNWECCIFETDCCLSEGTLHQQRYSWLHSCAW